MYSIVYLLHKNNQTTCFTIITHVSDRHNMKNVKTIYHIKNSIQSHLHSNSTCRARKVDNKPLYRLPIYERVLASQWLLLNTHGQ